VGEACLDYSAMLWQQRIVLTNIPVGTARVVFSGRDFGHFLIHPLVVNAAARAVQVCHVPPLALDGRLVLIHIMELYTLSIH
jgi:hypothetical protein